MPTYPRVRDVLAANREKFTTVMTTPGLPSFSDDENCIKYLFSERPIAVLGCQVKEDWLFQRLARDEKLREVSVSNFFMLAITLIIIDIIIRVTNTELQNFHKKSFIIKTLLIHIYASLASLLHWIKTILNHSSRKCHDILTVAALSFTKSPAITTA